MRKFFVSLMFIAFVIIAFTACSGNREQAVKVEDPVTIEQVNTDSGFVARAFIESVFTEDREMFHSCYPDGFVDAVGQAAGVDFFDEYTKSAKIRDGIVGTASTGQTDYTVENGYDAAYMRSRISFATGIEYDLIGQIRLQTVTAVFTNGTERGDMMFQFVVFEIDGSWYMFERYTGEGS